MFKKLIESGLNWLEGLLNAPNEPPARPYNHLEVLGITKLKPYIPLPEIVMLPQPESHTLDELAAAVMAEHRGGAYTIAEHRLVKFLRTAVNETHAERQRCLAILRDELDLAPEEQSELLRRIESGEPFTPRS